MELFGDSSIFKEQGDYHTTGRLSLYRPFLSNMNTYDVLKFKIYPWWKTKGKRADDYFLVCYVEKRQNMYSYAKGLKKQGVGLNLKNKWFAQATYHTDKKEKHLRGYVLFCKESIKDTAMVAHELIHVCQFYYHYNISPLCTTMTGQNHETFAHSHTFMMKRILKEAEKL